MSSLRTQTLWSMLPILITSVVSVLTVPIYFRVLGDEMYAMWFYVGTLTGAFGFMDLGVGVAVGRYVGVALGRNDRSAVEEYWATGHAIVFPFVLFFALVFVVVGAAWGPEWFKVSGGDATTLRWAILWGGVGLFFSYYGQMWNVLAQAHLDFKYLSILRTWVSLANVFGTVLVALVCKNVAAILAYSSILGLVQFALLYFRGNNHYKLPVAFSNFRKSRLMEMLPYTLKTFGHLVSGSVLGSLDRMILGRLASAADFAAFGVAQNVAGRLNGLSVAIMGPIFNNTTRGFGGDESRKPAQIYRDGFAFMFPWYLMAVVGSFFWSTPVTHLWLGEKYGNAVGDIFPWVIAALSLGAMANISTAQLGSLNRVGTSLVFQIIIAIASTVAVYIGWQLNGLLGSAIGFCTVRVIYFAQDGLVRHWVSIPFSEYVRVIPIIIRQVAAVGLVWTLWQQLPKNPALQCIGAVVSALFAAGVEFYFRRFNTSNPINNPSIP